MVGVGVVVVVVVVVIVLVMDRSVGGDRRLSMLVVVWFVCVESNVRSSDRRQQD